MKRKLLCIIIYTFCFSTMWITVANANHQTILNRIANKIVHIKNLITHDTNQRKKLQNDLEDAETNAGKITKQLQSIDKKLKQQEALLAELKKNKNHFQEKLNIQRTLLIQQIQTAYILSRQSYLKLLLNQESSDEVGRALMYYRFIHQRRIQAISDIQKTLAQIKKNQEKMKAEYQTLQSLQTERINQREQLAATQISRKRSLTLLNQHIQTKRQRLDVLIANQRRLENTLAQVARRSAEHGFPEAHFSQLNQPLSWPTHGQVMRIFGTKIEQSELRWGGVLIKAPEGQPVYAIAKGKVVFAKWLPGYGLLLIINHGLGYMTLYGRNHALYKKIGDLVHRGDLISTVGQTGGYQNPALYFAVRHDGKPINPALFIKNFDPVRRKK